MVNEIDFLNSYHLSFSLPFLGEELCNQEGETCMNAAHIS